MGKVAKATKPAKVTKTSKTASALSSAVSVGKSLIGGGSTAKGGVSRGKRHRKSIGWYAREISRLKLKKRYEKIKYRV